MSDKVRNFLSVELREVALALFAHGEDMTLEEIRADYFSKAEATRNTEIRLPDGFYRVSCSAEEMRQLAQEAWDTI